MTVRNRVRSIEKLEAKSAKSFKEAQLLFDQGFFEGAISRAYYSMFCLARAVLATKDLFRRRHSGVHAAFAEHFTKKGLLPSDLHIKLLRAFEERQMADYMFERSKTQEEANEIMRFAIDFQKQVMPFLEKWIQENQE